MLERRSPLSGTLAAEGASLTIINNVMLTQAAGNAKVLKQSFPKLSEAVGVAVDYAGKILLRIGPHQILVIGTPPDAHEGLHLTPLSSSRSCIALEGARAREVLAKCASIDFHPKVFTPGQFVMTGIHHMPALIHCTGADQFHIYIMRTFALSLWEILTDAAHS